MKIRRFTGGDLLPHELRGGIVAIGNFDGIHRGHLSVLERALLIARENRIPALVMTFEPHPRALFQPDHAPFRITPAPLKAKLLEILGFDAVIEQAFDHNFAKKSAQEFIEQILVDRFGISHVVTGFDFHFGKGREGGPAFLMKSGKHHHFGVTLVDAYRDRVAQVISSSHIRQLLCEGNLEEANALLGYRFTLANTVIKGQQIGRTLGYPTANMIIHQENGLKPGIYALRFRDQSNKLYNGVASFGFRPTIEENGKPILETYIFDFKGDLYGQYCHVHFVSYLREEEKFDDLDMLIAQMKIDEARAQALLIDLMPLGSLDKVMCFDG